MSIQTVNPATGEALETYEETSPRDLEQILARPTRRSPSGVPSLCRACPPDA